MKMFTGGSFVRNDESCRFVFNFVKVTCGFYCAPQVEKCDLLDPDLLGKRSSKFEILPFMVLVEYEIPSKIVQFMFPLGIGNEKNLNIHPIYGILQTMSISSIFNVDICAINCC